ncbi:MAG: transcriptional regulator MraZ [Phycisphaerae bacterium]|nr:MAG: transcriptional regulator MraZ [Phycisphaerae bacterium]
MAFTDAFERTLDTKNRTQIPADFRNAMDPAIHGETFYLCPGEQPNTLSLLPEKYFDELAERVRPDLLDGDEAQSYEILFFSLSKRLDMDKQGRVVLPDRQLAMVDIGKDITFAGTNKRIDIWATKEYLAYIDDEFKANWRRLKQFGRSARSKQARASDD